MEQACIIVSHFSVCFFSIRRKHMELMAQHKYGLRVRDNQVFAEMSRNLGLAAVTVDMLEVKHSSPIALSIQSHCGGASRGINDVFNN